MSCLDTARALLNGGFVPVVVKSKSKAPVGVGWGEKRHDVESVSSHWARFPTANVGVLLGSAGRLIDIEADGPECELVRQALFPRLPESVSFDSDKGRHTLFEYDERFNGLPSVIRLDTNGYRVGGDVPHVEVRLGTGKAAQSLLPPSVVGDGQPRRWVNSFSHSVAKLPEEFIRIILASHKQPSEKAREAIAQSDGLLTWHGILTKAGWKPCGDNHWTRPGDPKHPISGSILTAKDGTEIFHVLTASAEPLRFGGNYNRFALYAYLEHGGDFKAARKALSPTEPTIGEKLIAYPADLFKTPSGDTFATIQVDGHKETHKIESKAFKQWLGFQYFRDTGKPLSTQALTEAINTYSARALYGGTIEPVFVRVAENAGSIYLDLGTPDWTAVEISPLGCQVVPHPVKFRRPKSLLPLPAPDFTGTVADFRPFANVSDDNFKLLTFVLCSYLRPRGPYPILLMESQHGSAKSTTLRVSRRVFDPNTSDVRTAPDGKYDLFLSAVNSYCVTIDNISTLPEWLADGLCQLATRGGLGTREYYGQDDEKIIDAIRPVMVGCITDLTNRADFLSRCVLIPCLPLTEDSRRTEDDFYADYEKAQPRILGALCNGASAALRELPHVKMKFPRMADFAKWSAAAETGLGYPKGTFAALYDANREDVNEMTLSGPVAKALAKYLAEHKSFDGTATELLRELEPYLQADRPKNAQVLSRKLKRLVGVLPFPLTIRPNRITIAA